MCCPSICSFGGKGAFGGPGFTCILNVILDTSASLAFCPNGGQPLGSLQAGHENNFISLLLVPSTWYSQIYCSWIYSLSYHWRSTELPGKIIFLMGRGRSFGWIQSQKDAEGVAWLVTYTRTMGPLKARYYRNQEVSGVGESEFFKSW